MVWRFMEEKKMDYFAVVFGYYQMRVGVRFLQHFLLGVVMLALGFRV
jgi:hypothetical protein